MTKTKIERAAKLGTLILAFTGCAPTQGAPPAAGAAQIEPRRFFLTFLAPSTQYVIDGPAVLSYVDPKGAFLVGRNTPGGPQYIGPLMGPLTGQFFVPEGYFVSPQNPEGAVYSGQCFKEPTCFRFSGAPPTGR